MAGHIAPIFSQIPHDELQQYSPEPQVFVPHVTPPESGTHLHAVLSQWSPATHITVSTQWCLRRSWFVLSVGSFGSLEPHARAKTAAVAAKRQAWTVFMARGA